ncbi:hypothetical protein Q3G72_029629 [Acer saccharum]|nr:hypothetical protein Q3G72_029629 [Acer saccharum]
MENSIANGYLSTIEVLHRISKIDLFNRRSISSSIMQNEDQSAPPLHKLTTMDANNSFKSYIKANQLEEQAYWRRTRKRLIIITLSFIVLIMIITGALVGTLLPMKSTATSKENILSPTYSS